jgi:hypothetical protein
VHGVAHGAGLGVDVGRRRREEASAAEHPLAGVAESVAQQGGEPPHASRLRPGGVDDVLQISKTIMAPFPVTTSVLRLCVAHLTANATNTQVLVDWSRNSGDSTCPAKASAYTGTPANLISANQSIVLSRVKYEYSSPVKYFLKTNPTFTKLYYLKPRKSSKVTCSAC